MRLGCFLSNSKRNLFEVIKAISNPEKNAEKINVNRMYVKLSKIIVAMWFFVFIKCKDTIFYNVTMVSGWKYHVQNINFSGSTWYVVDKHRICNESTEIPFTSFHKRYWKNDLLFLIFEIPIKRTINTSVLVIKGKQRDIKEGSEGVQWGLPLLTPRKPPRNPLATPSELRTNDGEKNGVNRNWEKL